MIQSATFRRKVIYLGLIALLLIPLYVVGHPAVGDPTDSNQSPGGRLAQLRAKYDLSPAELGDIDPTSESMKLATLGMRGVAATVLWSKANEYKKKENWEGLVAVVNQMAKLQPNFISVWEFQSHNLSYNTSVEFDDYRFRYLWVKKGIEFLIQGTHYNRREPKLFWNVGWYTGQKFNRADESKQFRRLFKGDNDFHALQSRYVDVDGSGRGAEGRPDSWLVSRLWYNRAYDIVDNQGRPLRGKSPHIFFADGPKSLMNYAIAIEDEGYLDERAEYAWKRADDEWTRYGGRQIPTSSGLLIRLNDKEHLMAESERLSKELDELLPGIREAIRQEKIARLTPRQREAFNKELASITNPDEYVLHHEAQTLTQITNREVAERAPTRVRANAYRLSELALEAFNTADWIHRYRGNVNFEYWRTRCKTEQLRDTVTARRHIYTANQLKDKVELDAARQEYEKAWDLWAKIIDQNPALVEELTADDLMDHVEGYLKLLAQLDEQLPADFKLRSLLEKYEKLPAGSGAAANETSAQTPPAETKGEEKPADAPSAEPTEASDRPAQPADKPSETKEQPAEASDKPSDPADKASDSAAPSGEPTDKPEEPSDEPAGATDSPAEPAGKSEKPSNSEDKPTDETVPGESPADPESPPAPAQSEPQPAPQNG